MTNLSFLFKISCLELQITLNDLFTFSTAGILIPKKSNAKVCSNYHFVQTMTALFSKYASKVMLKIFQARLQQYVNHELPDVHTGFRKGKRTRVQIANIP